MSEQEKLADAVAYMLYEVKSNTSDRTYETVVKLCRIARALGHRQAKEERLEDIQLFAGRDDDEPRDT